MGLTLAAVALALTGTAAGVYISNVYTDHGTPTSEIADEMLVQLDRDFSDQVLDVDNTVREADVDVEQVECMRTAPERAACTVSATVAGEDRSYHLVVDIDRNTGAYTWHAE